MRRLKAKYLAYDLIFKQASGTSRGVLLEKRVYILKILDTTSGRFGIGEINMFAGLSADDRPEFTTQMDQSIDWIEQGLDLSELLLKNKSFPSIQFGIEQAFMSLKAEDAFGLFDNDFLSNQKGIPINGLIWMGTKTFMYDQIRLKLDSGFETIKMKIGAIDFQAELDLLKYIRSQFSSDEITLRVDANGAFSPDTAMEKLKRLSDFDIHSIEQPIAQGQIESMAALCESTPLPIALDEELIGVFDADEKKRLLDVIKPQFIILKPSLVGGYQGSTEWIGFADESGIPYWITSALESNVGLNAIAQWTASLDPVLPQGLGTGGLYTNNFHSPLFVESGSLFYNSMQAWDLNFFESI